MRSKYIGIYLLLLTVCCCAALAACGASTQLVAATTSDGTQYPYCLEVSYPVLTFKGDVLFCGTLAQVQAEQAKAQALHPEATSTIVRQLPVEDTRK
jgi:hypothetical protein